MRTSRIRRLMAVGALALICTAPLAACGGDSLSPMPVEAAEQASPSSAAPPVEPSVSVTDSSPPGTAAPASRAPRPASTKTKTVKPPQTDENPNCHGAVRYTLDLQSTELALVKSMCFKAGGTLRMRSIGPGLVSWTPESLVSANYEAAVQDLRFLRPGTVTVTIPQDEQTYTIEVVVIR